LTLVRVSFLTARCACLGGSEVQIEALRRRERSGSLLRNPALRILSPRPVSKKAKKNVPSVPHTELSRHNAYRDFLTQEDKVLRIYSSSDFEEGDIRPTSVTSVHFAESTQTSL